MTPFTKRELQTQINNIDTRIALLKLPTVTKEEAEKIQAELEKLNAARNELLEKLKVAPRMNAATCRQRHRFPQKSLTDILPRSMPEG